MTTTVHSYWFNNVKSWYDAGFYSKEDVQVYVDGGYITRDEYTEITGDPYPAAA